MLRKIKDYYRLTKPGIIRGNVVHVLAGAFFASAYTVDWPIVGAVLVGTSLVIASACVANNYLDRGIDAKMERTKRRASVTGSISTTSATIYGAILSLAGFLVLYVYTNRYVVSIGALAYILYVFVYGWTKRRSVHSTLVGAIPGALPIMAGYVAVNGQITTGALLLFLLVGIWQMPHFYAISVFRRKEYAAAGIPVLGVVKPFGIVRRYIFVYICLYLVTIIGLIMTNTISPAPGSVLVAGAGYWMYAYSRTISGDDVKWAKSIFGASLVLTLLLLATSVISIFVPSQL